jgi:hypothetical protein
MNNTLHLTNGALLQQGDTGPRVRRIVRTTGGFSTPNRRPQFE